MDRGGFGPVGHWWVAAASRVLAASPALFTGLEQVAGGFHLLSMWCRVGVMRAQGQWLFTSLTYLPNFLRSCTLSHSATREATRI